MSKREGTTHFPRSRQSSLFPLFSLFIPPPHPLLLQIFLLHGRLLLIVSWIFFEIVATTSPPGTYTYISLPLIVLLCWQPKRLILVAYPAFHHDSIHHLNDSSPVARELSTLSWRFISTQALFMELCSLSHRHRPSLPAPPFPPLQLTSLNQPS